MDARTGGGVEHSLVKKMPVMWLSDPADDLQAVHRASAKVVVDEADDEPCFFG
jgi:hypothetical protein